MDRPPSPEAAIQLLEPMDEDFCENNVGATYWDVNPLFLDFSTGYAQDDLLNALPSDGRVHDNTRGAQPGVYRRGI